MQLGARAAFAHLVHMHGVPARCPDADRCAPRACPSAWSAPRRSASSSGTLSVIGPSPRIWCSAGTGLFSHGYASPCAAVIDQAEALAFRVLEVERQAAVALGDLAGLARRPRSDAPSTTAKLSAPAMRRPVRAIECVPRCSRRRRPVEEGEVGAGPRQRVGVEQVIGAGVVLVDGLLHHAACPACRCRSACCPARRPRSRSDDGCR